MTPIYRSPDQVQALAMQSLLLDHRIQASIIETRKTGNSMLASLFASLITRMPGKGRDVVSASMTQCVLISLIALTISLPCVAANTQPSGGPVILIMGDSLSAGYGIETSKDWASLLEQRLVSENFPYRVVNASISGETTNGGLSRLAQALATHRPQIVIIELGANDGLRGLPLYLMRNNLEKMIELCQQANTRVPGGSHPWFHTSDCLGYPGNRSQYSKNDISLWPAKRYLAASQHPPYYPSRIRFRVLDQRN